VALSPGWPKLVNFGIFLEKKIRKFYSPQESNPYNPIEEF